MPVVRIYLDRLEELLGEKISAEELNDIIFTLKGEVEEVDLQRGAVSIELTMDRPDLLISEGIARAVKGLREREAGFPRLNARVSDYRILVEDVPSRPYIAIGIIRGYELDERTLEELIQFQEKIHLTVGRKRRKVAIGIHDLDKVRSKTLRYTAVPLSYNMIPLGHNTEQTVKEVLKNTPQGQAYGSYSLLGETHPAILADDEIISLPPVLNSDITRLEVGTKNLLIDVTGTDEYMVLKTLDLITSVLSERRGSHIELCYVKRGPEDYLTPGLTPTYVEMTLDYVRRTLGINLSGDDVVRLGEKMRWEVLTDGSAVRAGAPEYRLDVLHPIDFVEDVSIAYGYSSFALEEKPVITRPREDPYHIFKKIVRELLIGQGFTQFMGFTMISDALASIAPEEAASPLRILNPISAEMSSVRPSIIPSLIQVIRESQKSGLPLRVFEIGHYAFVDPRARRLIKGEKVGIAVVDYRIGYEDIQQFVEGLLSSLGIPHAYHRYDSDIFIRGRSSAIKRGDVLLGYVGEIYPQVLLDNGVKYPVGVAELYLDKLYEVWRI